MSILGSVLKRQAPHLMPLVLSAFVLSGCASVSIPFSSLGGGTSDAQLTTGSIDSSTDLSSSQTEMPPPLATAVAPPQPVEVVRPAGGDRPAEALVAVVETTPQPMSFTQADLDALGAQLTRKLAADAAVGTFDWSIETSGLSGAMTPFRSAQTGNEACRMVSVEVSDGNRDAIVLADACQRDGQYVFTTPQAGQAL
ncbi:MAG: hypothetical protein AAF739_00560 [Pseudomonadota bacterium]